MKQFPQYGIMFSYMNPIASSACFSQSFGSPLTARTAFRIIVGSERDTFRQHMPYLETQGTVLTKTSEVVSAGCLYN